MYYGNGSVLKKGDPVLGALLPIWEQKGEVNFRWLRGGIPERQERSWGPDTVPDPTNFKLRSEAADEVLDRLLSGFAIRQSPTIEEGLLHRDVTVPTSLQLSGWPSLGVVRFTLDGSLPTGASKMYSEPISIVDNLIVSAQLFDETGQALAPPWLQAYTFSPLTLHPGGLLPDSQWFEDSIILIVISTMETGKIRYTLDGSVPVAASPAFIEPLVLNESAVVGARPKC